MEQLLAILPFVLLFAICPLMMLFMHRGRGGHETPAETPMPAARLTDEVKKT